VPRRVVVLIAAGTLFGASVSPALAQDSPEPPVVTVPTEPPPNPDPAPKPKPPQTGGGGGGGGGGSSAPETPAPVEEAPAEEETAQPAEAGRTPAEIKKRQQEARERQREQQQREREQQQLERLRERTEAIRVAGLEAFAGVTEGVPDLLIPTEAPATIELEPAAAPSENGLAPGASQTGTQASARQLPSVVSDASGSSSLRGAAPVLVGLLALAVVLLSLAAVPPWTFRSPTVAGLLTQRRLEIGLIGTAVLASAAIGLVVAVIAA
jgi:hypothetical protein